VTVVLDTSAVLAVIFGEDGAERVAPHLTPSAGVISAVNFAEVATKLVDRRYSDEDARSTLADLKALVRPLQTDVAMLTGLLRRVTRSRGLSLGDRACLALARTEGCPAVTADRKWRDIAEAADVSIEVIR
jgi:PIN domain nuclease of toxin-antitoxin system